MKPVEQSILKPPDGDCFAACMASLLELPLEAVPNFTSPDWYQHWQEWLEPFNLTLLTFTIPDGGCAWLPSGYALLCAESPRGPWDHSVVCLDGKVVWDPNPQREQGLGKWKEWTLIAVLDPSRPIGVKLMDCKTRPNATKDLQLATQGA